MIELNREELAYAGGLFEGEGTIYVRNITPPGAWVCVSMTDREPIERFQAAIGGFGKIYGPYSRKGRDHKPYYIYHLYNFEQVQAVVVMLWPWLGPRRREQAVKTLDHVARWAKAA